MVRILGIESSAHTLGMGIVDNGRIVSNIKVMYRPRKGEGILPREAADFHASNFASILRKTLENAGVEMNDVDGFAFTVGPGMGPCLQIGAAGAKALALRSGKPLYPVNHCVAHIEITRYETKMKDPVIVYVSGGNTQIIIRDGTRYRILGETMDIGLGNMLDNLGRVVGLEFAHGSEIEKLAKEGRYIKLPYTVKGMDLSFTGLLTEAERRVRKGTRIEDICFSVQETAFSMLVEATERAMALTKKDDVVVCGGVAQNRRLQKMLQVMAEERGGRFGVARNEFNADNGAMIAYVGWLMHKAGMRFSPDQCIVRQRFRVDQVEIRWPEFI